MNKNLITLLFAVLFSCVFWSCKKTPGQGGNASIKGKVWVQQYDPFFTILEQEYFGPNVTVELTFGDNISPDENVKTNANGEFEFLYLRKGKYKITVYSKTLQNSQNPSGTIAVDASVNITDKKQVVDVGTLNIKK